MSNYGEVDVVDVLGCEKLVNVICDVVNVCFEMFEGFGGIEDVFFILFVLQQGFICEIVM